MRDRTAIDSPEGRREFPVVGIANEYIAAGLVVILDAAVAKRCLDVDGVDGVLVTVTPERHADVQVSLRRLADDLGLLLQSNAQFRNDNRRRIRGVQASLMALLSIGLATAAAGIVNWLLMNVLEQTREFGLLRAIGCTRRQIERTVLAQVAVFVLAAVAVGLPLGLAFHAAASVILEAATSQRVTWRVHQPLTMAVPAVATLLACAAAVIPARRVAALRPLEALRYE